MLTLHCLQFKPVHMPAVDDRHRHLWDSPQLSETDLSWGLHPRVVCHEDAGVKLVHLLLAC